MAVPTTMAAITVVSALVACRPTRHRSFDEFHVLWLGTLRPGRVGPFHCRNAMAVLISDEQGIVTPISRQLVYECRALYGLRNRFAGS